MGMPNIPDIQPNITVNREEVINLLLASVALEEISLAHIMNAEGEKIQKVLGKPSVSLDDLLKINCSVERTLRSVIKKEILLEYKFDNILELLKNHTGCSC